MSVGPMGMAGSAAGSHLPQTKADKEKAQQQTTEQARAAQSNDKAEQAAGIGQTEQDEQASDRDADGRRLWEQAPEKPDDAADQENDESQSSTDVHGEDPRAKDPTGESGTQLDLSG